MPAELPPRIQSTRRMRGRASVSIRAQEARAQEARAQDARAQEARAPVARAQEPRAPVARAQEARAPVARAPEDSIELEGVSVESNVSEYDDVTGSKY